MAPKPLKALVVDDENNWCNAIASTAKKTGIDIRKTTDAATAVDCLRNDKSIKVLFQDWFLEGNGTTSVFDDVLIEAARNNVLTIIITAAPQKEAYRRWQNEQTIPWDDYRYAVGSVKQEHLIYKWEIGSGLETGFLPLLEQKIRQLHLPKTVKKLEKSKLPRLLPPFMLRCTGDESCPDGIEAQIISKHNSNHYLQISEPNRARFLYRLANIKVDDNEGILSDKETAKIFDEGKGEKGREKVDSFIRWLCNQNSCRIESEDIKSHLFQKVRSHGWKLCIQAEDVEIA